MKKQKEISNEETIVFNLFEITTKKSDNFLHELCCLCEKYAVRNEFDFNFQFEE